MVVTRLTAIALICLLTACGDGNPFVPVEDDTPTDPVDDGDDDGDGLTVGGITIPPGTSNPSVGTRIFRFEDRNASGGGYAQDFVYDSVTDTFTVDNLAFDGENTYQRDDQVSSLGPNAAYAVYEADIQVTDSLDGDPVGQIVPYRALVGLSTNTETDADGNLVPRTSFAIVRTGGFVQYGFGGFVYEREGGVVLPESGQAVFTGDYAGVRIFDGAGGLEYTQGDMTMEIDFADPNDASGVKGRVFNRVAFGIDGTPITLGNDPSVGELPLPDIRFVLDGDNGNLNPNGEALGEVFSTYVDPSGIVVEYETGTYFAILSGDTTDPADGGEIVGVMVLESTDARFPNAATAQETGGFILYR